MSTFTLPALAVQNNWKAKLKFERDMLFSAAVLLMTCPVLLAMHTNFSGEWPILLSLFALFACAMPIVVCLREAGKHYWANIISVVYFSFFFAVAFRFVVYLTIRAGSTVALKDTALMHIEQSFGMAVPDVMRLAKAHWIGRAINWTYFQIEPFMRWTLLLPVLLNRPRGSRIMIKASLLAFAIGMPMAVLLPAVGPWYGYHTGGDPIEMKWTNEFLAIRAGQDHITFVAGLISFPSFHVVWAIVGACAVWEIKLLRVPAALMAIGLTLSTVTNGEHYVLDMLSGVVVAVLACWLAMKWEA